MRRQTMPGAVIAPRRQCLAPSMPGAVDGTRMAETPKKITDDPYGAAILIRRLIMEQAIIY